MAVASAWRRAGMRSTLIGARRIAPVEELAGALANLRFTDAEVRAIDWIPEAEDTAGCVSPVT